MPLAEPLQQIDRTMVRYRGRKLIYFGGCDYFRLASHPEVLRALHDGAEKFGLNAAASRATTGNHVLFGKLESELARFFGVERAALLSNGYATNLAFAQTFASEFTHALMDKRAHGSQRDAAQALDCPVRSFRHRDAQDFRRVLARCGRAARPLVITDGMFSHDGSLAALDEYLDALPARGVLLVDDAHGAGTLGRSGRGTPQVCGVRDKRLVQTISLSKAFGVYGGAVLGTKKIVEAIQDRSRIFRGNTPPPLPLVNAALASLKILKSDPSLRARLKANTARIKGALRATDLPIVDNASPIVPLIPRDALHALRIRQSLLRAGIFPSLIRYAETPPPGYFRFAISSEHTRAHLDLLAEILVKSAETSAHC
jgi:7-keto-8-aminopelargonate synthetase-like enzyme